jgi:hypothetical protein
MHGRRSYTTPIAGRILTKEQLQEQLNSGHRLVYAVFGTEEKYGRPLATLYQTSSEEDDDGNPKIANKSINDMMREYINSSLHCCTCMLSYQGYIDWCMHGELLSIYFSLFI